jgi:hypothetical protein
MYSLRALLLENISVLEFRADGILHSFGLGAHHRVESLRNSLDEPKDFAVPNRYLFGAVLGDQNGSRVGTDEPIGLGLSYKEWNGASAVPTFCDEIPHKLFPASWQTPKFPKFVSFSWNGTR